MPKIQHFLRSPILRLPRLWGGLRSKHCIRISRIWLQGVYFRQKCQIPKKLPRYPPIPTDLRSFPKNYFYGVGLVLKISSRSLYSIKSFQLFSQGQTHRQTRALPSIYRWAKFLMPFQTSFTSPSPLRINISHRDLVSLIEIARDSITIS